MIVVHRLLKNEVVEKLGIPAYALFSQACIDAAGLDPVALGMREHTETYERIGDVPVWVLDLERRWQEEEARGRVFVDPEKSILIVSVPTEVPPQVAWEFITKPGQRMSWQPWVTEVAVEGATGGRRGPGSANHCMHGKDAVIEEILDWRPVRLRHRPDGPRRTDRADQAAPHGRVRADHRRDHDPFPLRGARRPSARRS